MRAGIVTLVLAYVLSQFYRAFLAVMAPVLNAEIGATPEDLSQASGLWFLIFAAMQIPVGWLLDNVGPRRTASVLFALGAGGGAAVFAMAQGPGQVNLAMALIGIGCSPVLVASYFTFARMFPARVFGTLAGMVVGIGTIGNLVASWPMAFAVDTIGWRETMWVLSAISVGIAVVLAILVKDPPAHDHGGGEKPKGSILTILAIPAIWPILALQFVNYAPSAAIRGLWAGPYLDDAYQLDTGGIGAVTLIMAIFMIIGNFAYGPADRLFGTRKWVLFGGNLASGLSLLALALVSPGSPWGVAALLAAVGLFGSSFPLIMAHARAFFPAHLTGTGVTLVNLMGIGGVAVFQFISGALYPKFEAASSSPAAPYQSLFLIFGVAVLVGCAAYLFSRDSTA